MKTQARSASHRRQNPPSLSASSDGWRIFEGNGKVRTLLRRCVRAYAWTPQYDERAMGGYRQFLELKKQLGDWDATALSPSVPVDLVWHQHILDTRHYAGDCATICGGVVHHNPDGGEDRRQRRIRRSTTKVALQARFGLESIHSHIWRGVIDRDRKNVQGDDGDQEDEEEDTEEEEEDNDGDDCGFDDGDSGDDDDEVESGEEHEVMSQKRRHNETNDTEDQRWSRGRHAANDDSGEVVRLRIRACNGNEARYIMVGQSMKLGEVFRFHAHCIGLSLSSLLFLVDGDRISGEATLESLELDDDCQIDVHCEHGGFHKNLHGTSELIRDGNGDEAMYIIDRRMELGGICIFHKHCMGLTSHSVSFVVHADQIREDATVEGLELEDDDQIDLMLEQCGC